MGVDPATRAEFRDRLSRLYAVMDAAYDQAAAAHGFLCDGCGESCCRTRFHHHTLVEYHFLREGFERLAGPRRERILRRAEAVQEEVAAADASGAPPRAMCPLNEEGRCGLYAERPMICRLHGVPHELSRPGLPAPPVPAHHRRNAPERRPGLVKRIDEKDLERLPGLRLQEGGTFRFRCHPGIGCFNRCCRNLNLFLYPYDVIRLKSRLGLGSDEFLDRHVDVVLRPGGHFPDVLLRMAENAEKTCPFLAPEGCRVYPDRPDACRTFPLEQGLRHGAEAGRDEALFLFRPPDFCLGRHEEKQWTVPEWVRDQEAEAHHRMTVRWAELRRLFQDDPWGAEGPTGARARMTFMAAYNIDRFREFVFGSSFLKRFKVDPETLRKMKKDDAALLLLGFDWIKLFLWGIRSRNIKPR